MNRIDRRRLRGSTAPGAAGVAAGGAAAGATTEAKSRASRYYRV